MPREQPTYPRSIARDTAAVSEENVEVMRQAFAALSSRNLDRLLDLTDPNVVAVPRTLRVEGGVLRGHEGIRRWWEGIFSAFPDFDVEVLSARALDDLTIAEVRTHGRGGGSGAPFEDVIWMASRFREGRLVWWQSCASEAEALEAAGLAE